MLNCLEWNWSRFHSADILLCRWILCDIYFSVAHSETAPKTISLAWCPISTFTLTIPVNPLKAELITLLFCNSHHTIYHYSYNFPHSYLHRNLHHFIQYIPNMKFQWLSVLPCSSNNFSILWGQKQKAVPDFKKFQYLSPSNNRNCRTDFVCDPQRYIYG